MNNIPQERQDQILEWLAEARLLRIDELAERLNVSQMTVHRDLDALASKALVEKIHGGVRLPNPLRMMTDTCHMCRMPVQPRLHFVMHTAEAEALNACCAHCGLLLLHNHTNIETALLRDFLYGNIVNVFQAYFVVESRIITCCRPGVLAFAGQTDANDFQRGFGGTVMNYTDAQDHLAQGHHCSHE